MPICVMVLTAGIVANFAGVRVTVSGSLPRGVYWVERDSAYKTGITRPLLAGDIVEFCPPDTEPFRLARDRGYIQGGLCAGGFEEMMKPVIGRAGDLVEIGEGGVSINGTLVPLTTVSQVDERGRLLPHAATSFVLEAGDLFLVSTWNPRSYDSRYFGPVHATQVIGVAHPVWTEGPRRD